MIDIQSDSVLKKISFKYLANLIKIATIQPKNLTKIIKIFTIVIVFQQQKKKKKKKTILPPNNQKIICY